MRRNNARQVGNSGKNTGGVQPFCPGSGFTYEFRKKRRRKIKAADIRVYPVRSEKHDMQTLSLSAAESFEEVMELYMPMVYRIALSRLGDRSEAEDITQEVFLRYFRTGMTYSSEEHRKAWLIRCTVNCAINSATSAWNRHRASGEMLENSAGGADEPADPGCEEQFEKTERRMTVLSAVNRLPEKYRVVIHLFYFEDMSVAQISAATGDGISTVKSQLSRARKLLKPILSEEFPGEVVF